MKRELKTTWQVHLTESVTWFMDTMATTEVSGFPTCMSDGKGKKFLYPCRTVILLRGREISIIIRFGRSRIGLVPICMTWRESGSLSRIPIVKQKWEQDNFCSLFLCYRKNRPLFLSVKAKKIAINHCYLLFFVLELQYP